MKILIDINHPAHVHYFRNFIETAKKNGYQFCIIARNKEVSFDLLEHYRIEFISRGKSLTKLPGKIFYMLWAGFFILYHSIKFKPDVFISFGSIYLTIISFLLRKPHLAFNDTEYAPLLKQYIAPFSTLILTPSCFKKDLGRHHYRFESYMELCYLHPNYFKPNPSIFTDLKINPFEKYVIVRFVSWEASHDIGQHGFTDYEKIKFIKTISNYIKVFISSEGYIPEEIQKYKLNHCYPTKV